MADSIKQVQLKNHIRDIHDFPKEGIIFKDITTLLQNKDAFKTSVDLLADKYKKDDIDLIVGVEARGFIFGAALAYKLGVGFVPVRKKGKLPYKTKSITYELEYGSDELEIHEDALPKGSRVLIVDDLLATGGTIRAVSDLVIAQEAVIVGLAVLVELMFLNGRDLLEDLPFYSVLKY